MAFGSLVSRHLNSTRYLEISDSDSGRFFRVRIDSDLWLKQPQNASNFRVHWGSESVQIFKTRKRLKVPEPHQNLTRIRHIYLKVDKNKIKSKLLIIKIKYFWHLKFHITRKCYTIIIKIVNKKISQLNLKLEYIKRIHECYSRRYSWF